MHNLSLKLFTVIYTRIYGQIYPQVKNVCERKFGYYSVRTKSRESAQYIVKS